MSEKGGCLCGQFSYTFPREEWKMVVKHYDSIANQSHEMITDVTYDSGRKCHRDAYLMNVNSKDGTFSNLTTSDLVRYFCVALPKK